MHGLKSRAAFKLLQVFLSFTLDIFSSGPMLTITLCKIDEKYKIFRSGQSVVDLVGHFILENLLFNYCLSKFSNGRAMPLALGPKYVKWFLVYFLLQLTVRSL